MSALPFVAQAISVQARQFIDDHGGSTAVARATGKEPGAVALWRHRNKIPRSAWPDLILAFDDVTMATLLSIESADAAEAKAA